MSAGDDCAYAYLHGFASSPLAKKGSALAERFAARGLELRRPDLNRPSFAQLRVSAQLEALDALDEAHAPPGGWVLIGSSMGAWAGALWSACNPSRVRRAFWLAPAFFMRERWPAMLGEQAWARWQEAGSLPLPDATGEPVPVHWGLVEDTKALDPAPAPPEGLRVDILHGRKDEVVPVEVSRRYAAAHPKVELTELDDDHGLHASIDPIWAHIEAGLGAAADATVAGTLHWDFFGPQAEPTAQHFLVHLDEFLAREKIEGCRTGVASQRAGHAATWCETPAKHEATLISALRPRRKT